MLALDHAAQLEHLQRADNGGPADVELNARATIAAAPKILADLVELVAGAEKDANRTIWSGRP
ncbi:hypothetical protein [Microbispora bryophytorum]|uniref:hypothetical protein n=1 Tax=Microbispora bryophytorum TaxID=1460882 RepID=UPI003713288A